MFFGIPSDVDKGNHKLTINCSNDYGDYNIYIVKFNVQ